MAPPKDHQQKFPLREKDASEVFSKGEIEHISQVLLKDLPKATQSALVSGHFVKSGVVVPRLMCRSSGDEQSSVSKWRKRNSSSRRLTTGSASAVSRLDHEEIESFTPPTKRRLVVSSVKNMPATTSAGENSTSVDLREMPQSHSAATLLTPMSSEMPLPSPGASPTHLDESGESMVEAELASKAVQQASELIGVLPSGSLATRYLLWQLLQRVDRPTLSTLQRVIRSSLRKDIVQSLPSEVAYKIFFEFDYRTLLKASEVCKGWETISQQGSADFWKHLILRDNLVMNEEEYDLDKAWIQRKRPNLNPGELARLIYKRRYMIGQRWREPTFHPVRITLPCQGPNVITCLQFDDDKIAAGSDDNNITIYDTHTGKLRAVLSGHSGGVWAMKYYKNTLASGSTDRTVRIWNIKQGRCTYIFRGHVSTVRCLDIIEPRRIGTDDEGNPIVYPKTPLLVTGSRDATLFVWRLPVTGEDDDLPNMPIDLDEHSNKYLLYVLRGHTGSVRAVTGSANILISASYDTTARVWDLRTGECKFVLSGHADRIYSCVYDVERNQCYTGSVDNTIRIWDLNTGKCKSILEGHQMLVGLITLSPHALVSAAADWTVRIWDPDTGKPRNVLRGHNSAITCVQNNDYFIVSGSQGMLKLWDTKTGEFIRDLVDDVSGAVWQARFDYRRCIAAVQKTDRTCLEILDFCPPESDYWAMGSDGI